MSMGGAALRWTIQLTGGNFYIRLGLQIELYIL